MKSGPPLGTDPSATGADSPSAAENNGATETPAAAEQRISLPAALGILAGTLVLVLVIGFTVGYRFFWNKTERVIRLDAEVARWAQVLQQDPKNFQALYQIGWTYYQKGDLEQALKYNQAAVEVQPDHAGAVYNLGLAYLDLKQYEQAAVQFKTLADQYPDHEMAWFCLGRSYLELGRLDDAAATLAQTVQINPTSADTLYYLGLTYERLGKQEQAILQYQEALTYDPKYAPAAEALGRLGVSQP